MELFEILVRITKPSILATRSTDVGVGHVSHDVRVATTTLDRFLADATTVRMSGKSYRLRPRRSTTHDGLRLWALPAIRPYISIR